MDLIYFRNFGAEICYSKGFSSVLKKQLNFVVFLAEGQI